MFYIQVIKFTDQSSDLFDLLCVVLLLIKIGENSIIGMSDLWSLNRKYRLLNQPDWQVVCLFHRLYDTFAWQYWINREYIGQYIGIKHQACVLRRF